MCNVYIYTYIYILNIKYVHIHVHIVYYTYKYPIFRQTQLVKEKLPTVFHLLCYNQTKNAKTKNGKFEMQRRAGIFTKQSILGLANKYLFHSDWWSNVQPGKNLVFMNFMKSIGAFVCGRNILGPLGQHMNFVQCFAGPCNYILQKRRYCTQLWTLGLGDWAIFQEGKNQQSFQPMTNNSEWWATGNYLK